MNYRIMFMAGMSCVVLFGNMQAITSKKAMRDFQKAVNAYTPGDEESLQAVKQAYKVVYATFPKKSFPVLHTRFTRAARKTLLDAGTPEADYKEIISMKSKPSKKQLAAIATHLEQQKQLQDEVETAMQEMRVEQSKIEPQEIKIDQQPMSEQEQKAVLVEKSTQKSLPMGPFLRSGKNGLYINVDDFNPQQQQLLKNIGRVR